MNLPGTTGESSCKRQENGDRVEPQRPLKKARFAWEVKGKYHLRNELSQAKSQTETAVAGSSSEHEAKLVGNTEQNLEILGDYLLKQDFNTLDSIPDTPLLPSPNISSGKLTYVSSYETRRDFSESSSSNEHIPVPNSLVYSNKDAEDQCIARWQARQMAKCFVDNTINHVLDSWIIAPRPADTDNNRVFALDAAEFINNLPGDNSIENEAILMAISAHGLQNNSSSCSSNNLYNFSQSYTPSKSTMSTPSSPLPSDEEAIQESNPCNNDSNQIDESSSNDFDMAWPSHDVKQNDNDNTPVFYPDTSNFSYQYFSESDNPNSSNTGDEGDDNVNSNDNNHYDFLDAAVSFAIQYKGLTSYGTDYG